MPWLAWLEFKETFPVLSRFAAAKGRKEGALLRKLWILAAVLIVASPALASTRQRVSHKGDAPLVLAPRAAATVNRAPSELPASWMLDPKSGISAKGLVAMLQPDETVPQGTVPRGFSAMLQVDASPVLEGAMKPNVMSVVDDTVIPKDVSEIPDPRKKQPREGD